MKRIPLEFAVLAVAVAATVAVARPAHAQGTNDSADKLARGKYLVTTSGCNDCHTPWKMGPKGPEPDMTRMLSGHPEGMALPPAPQPQGPWIVAAAATNTAWSGPWGVSFTANLTPDPETGLGKWTQRNFSETIRTGRHMGRGRQILPPMPIPMYRNFTDADLEAIFSYLQSIPPIQNRVPEPLPPAASVAQK
ncbi:MAG TPA: c-type cytochrome [Burkholderiaceae bacterium]|nr:c-type cytochrome [Burkholderiaceae bacterium]